MSKVKYSQLLKGADFCICTHSALNFKNGGNFIYTVPSSYTGVTLITSDSLTCFEKNNLIVLRKLSKAWNSLSKLNDLLNDRCQLLSTVIPKFFMCLKVQTKGRIVDNQKYYHLIIPTN